MIFIDTSAIYALAATSDPNHVKAQRLFEITLRSGDPLLSHNYVLIESFALLQRRLGLRTANAFARESERFTIEWIDAETHASAIARWVTGKPNVSFVDHVSFGVMERLRIRQAFAFDDDFRAAGFVLIQ